VITKEQIDQAVDAVTLAVEQVQAKHAATARS
jgi:hypothetical protein